MMFLELLGRFERNFGEFRDTRNIPTVRTHPPKAIVELESGMALRVDGRMRWEKAT